MPLFNGDQNDPQDLGDVIRQAIGLASVSWIEDPETGERVFDDATALATAREVEEWINEHYDAKDGNEGGIATSPNVPDVVEIYNDGSDDQPWRWRKFSHGNHKKIAAGGEGFSSETAAIQAAGRAEPGATIRVNNGG